MKINRTASAAWTGGLKDGKGSISTESGALAAYPYGFAARFEGKKGTNPEELLGAAHAGCFTMALAFQLQTAGYTPSVLRTEAAVSLDPDGAGFKITRSALILSADVPGLDKETFDTLAKAAEANCPVSRLMTAEITLDATLI